MSASGDRFEFRLPDLAEGIHDVQVLEWSVQPGERVEAFQPICVVESAKAAVEMTAPVAGRIADIRVPAGGTARVGEVLVVIDTTSPPANGAHGEAGEAGPAEEEYFGIVGAPPFSPVAGAPTPPASPSTSAPAAPSSAATVPLGRTSPSRDASSTTSAAPSPERRALAAPFVRRLARDLGVRLEDVPGSGPRGRIRAADVEAFAQAATGAAIAVPAARPTPAGVLVVDEERVPFQGLRKRIAEHLVEAVRRAPLVTAMDLFDVTELVSARQTLQARAEAEGVKLTYLPFVVKAVVEALRAVPEVNAVVDEEAQAVVIKRAYNVGIATAVPGGLVVPVLKAADQLTLLELAREIGRLVEAARERRSTPADLADGTFSITSFGGLAGGVMYATPIVNHPQVAILGMGRIEEQPRVVGGQVVPRHCLPVSFTFDHRVLDGEGASRFLQALRRPLEQPLELLLRLR